MLCSKRALKEDCTAAKNVAREGDRPTKVDAERIVVSWRKVPKNTMKRTGKMLSFRRLVCAVLSLC